MAALQLAATRNPLLSTTPVYTKRFESFVTMEKTLRTARTISPTALSSAFRSGGAPLLAMTSSTSELIASTTSSEAYNHDWYCSSKNSRFSFDEVVLPTKPCSLTSSLAYFSS